VDKEKTPDLEKSCKKNEIGTCFLVAGLLFQSKVKGILPCLKRKVLVPPKGPVLHCLFILTIKKPVIAHGLF
jgi:hypothetical protein